MIGDTANHGIIGLSPRKDTLHGEQGWWPTDGYDGPLYSYDWDAATAFGKSGHTREEWLALADVMIARWQEWRAHIAALDP